MKNLISKFLMLIVLCSSLLAHAESMTLEVIPMQHRSADDVVHILQPLVAPGGTVTGMNNQLVIKTTPENMAELKHVLQSLDRSPRRLLISVRQNSVGISQDREQGLSGKYSSGNVTSEIRDPARTRDGLVISTRDEKGNVVRYRQQDSVSNSNDQNSFRVQATEGYPAFINVGQSIPVQNRTAYVTPDGVVVNDSTQYVDATSGFYALPRLNGDQVTVLIAPSLSKSSTGGRPVFDVQNAETTATGRLGEWLEIGGIDQSSSGTDRKLLSSSNRQGQLSNTIFIKVDEVK